MSMGIALGLALGATGRVLTTADRVPVGTVRLVIPSTPSQEATTGDRLGTASAPRPSLDQVLAADGLEQRLFLARYLQGATIDEVLELIELSFDRQHARSLGGGIEMIYQRGVHLDPRAMVAVLEEHSGEHDYHLARIFSAWVKADADAAVAASEGRPKRIREAVIQALSEDDPDRALALLEEETWDSRNLRRRLVRNRMEQMLESDLEGALEHALELESQDERRSALSTVLAHWAEKDPRAALAWLRNADNEHIPGHEHLIGQIMPELAKTHPGEAQAFINDLPMSVQRGKLEASVLKELASEDMAAALQRLRSYPKGSYRDYLLSQIVDPANPPKNLLSLIQELEVDVTQSGRLAGRETVGQGWSSTNNGGSSLTIAVEAQLFGMMQEDPEQALREAFTMFGTQQSHQTTKLISQWAIKDAKAAAAWALALPEGPFATSLQRNAMEQWAHAEPADAAEMLREHGALSRDSVAGVLADAWSRKDHLALLDWAGSLSEEDRGAFLPEAIKRAATVSPEDTVAHLDAIPADEDRHAAIATVGMEWGNQSPQEALTWMQSQAEEVVIGPTMKATSKAWVLQAPEEASTWISTLESGSRRDHVVAGMVHALVSSSNPQRDFDGAQAWVETIADPALRAEWVGEIQTRLAKEQQAPSMEIDAGVSIELIP